MNLSIHLVTWNGAEYLPYLFDSLKKQAYKDWRLLIWDNGSADGTGSVLEKELAGGWCEYKIIKSENNIGFASAHDRLWDFARQNSDFKYLSLLNQDMYLQADCLENLNSFMDAHVEAGAVTPRLMKWNFAALKRGEGLANSLTEQIDSLGLKAYRSGRVVDIGNQKLLEKMADSVASVFGVSGALPFYRRTAIEQTGLFDEDFFMYKEDVDLAYRLRRAGWQSYAVLDAVAYHDRSAAGPKEDNRRAIIANRRNKPAWANYYSYRNHLFVLFKNLSGRDWLGHWPFILWYELQKKAYLLLLEPKTLWGAWVDFFRFWPKMKEKRKAALSLNKHV